MLEFIIPLLASWLPVWNVYIIPLFCLAFIAFVGCFLRNLLRE